MIVWVTLLMLLIPGTAGAASRTHLHGLVLGGTPARGEIIVRHDAFGGMPSMTMPFAVIPRQRAAELPAGAIIDADVDTSTEPWTLRHVTTKAAQSLTSDGLLRRATVLKPGDPVPDTAFVDQAGRPFSFAQLRGGDVVLAFIYTRCQDARMCPLVSGKFHALQGLLGNRRAHLVEVTLDPSFDRPPVLARYARAFGADRAKWTLAVGDANATLDFAARFGVNALPDPAAGVIHNEDTVLIGPDGRIAEMITENAWSPDEIVAQLDAMNARGGDPIKRFNLWLSRSALALCGNNQAAYSGLQDLIVVAAILAALWFFGRRLYRLIFVENA